MEKVRSTARAVKKLCLETRASLLRLPRRTRVFCWAQAKKGRILRFAVGLSIACVLAALLTPPCRLEWMFGVFWIFSVVIWVLDAHLKNKSPFKKHENYHRWVWASAASCCSGSLILLPTLDQPGYGEKCILVILACGVFWAIAKLCKKRKWFVMRRRTFGQVNGTDDQPGIGFAQEIFANEKYIQEGAAFAMVQITACLCLIGLERWVPYALIADEVFRCVWKSVMGTSVLIVIITHACNCVLRARKPVDTVHKEKRILMEFNEPEPDDYKTKRHWSTLIMNILIVAQGLTCIFWLEHHCFLEMKRKTTAPAAQTTLIPDKTFSSEQLGGSGAVGEKAAASVVRATSRATVLITGNAKLSNSVNLDGKPASGADGRGGAQPFDEMEYFQGINEALNTHYSLLVALIAAIAIILQRREVMSQREEMANMNRHHRQTMLLHWTANQRNDAREELRALASRDYLAESLIESQYFGSSLLICSYEDLRRNARDIASNGKFINACKDQISGNSHTKHEIKTLLNYLRGVWIRKHIETLEAYSSALIGLNNQPDARNESASADLAEIDKRITMAVNRQSEILSAAHRICQHKRFGIEIDPKLFELSHKIEYLRKETSPDKLLAILVSLTSSGLQELEGLKHLEEAAAEAEKRGN